MTTINCSRCGKSVSSAVPESTVVRAWVECPDCIEKDSPRGDQVSTDYQIPTIRCGSADVPHNNKRWTSCRNRHSTTRGNSWGWIEGAPGNVCWSNDNTVFNEASAGLAVKAHNDWLESQKSLDVQLIEAKEKLDAAQDRVNTMRKQLDEAESVLSEASETMRRLIEILDDRKAE